MVDEPAAALKTDIRNGVIAIDVNVGHLAIAIIDRHGNPIGRMRLNFPTADVESGKAKAMIGEAVRTVCLLALEKGYEIAIEDLDFAKKKAGLREYGAAHARRLSGLAYAKFQEMIAARCKRDGIDFHKVNPAYTSVIGRTKYAPARSMPPHDAAALVIGRRAMGYGERFVTMDDAILDGPARNRPRTEWRRWRGVRRLAREVPLEGAVRTARSDCEATGTGARQRASRQSGRSSARARIEPHHNQVGDAVVPATGNNRGSFDLDQAVNAWRGGVEFRISDAKESIQATAARITRMTQQLEKAKTERRRKSLSSGSAAKNSVSTSSKAACRAWS